MCTLARKTFLTNNLGELTFYTGCSFEFANNSATLKMSQAACVDKAVERFSVGNDVPLPACPLVEIRSKEETEPIFEGPFREAVVCLMWLVNMTWPDITNAVRELARQAHTPTEKTLARGIAGHKLPQGNPGHGFDFLR